MTKYNGERSIKIITKHIAQHNFSQEIKEDLMIKAILPAIREIYDNRLIECSAEQKQLSTLKDFVEFSNILCSFEFIEFVKNYNK